MHYNTKKLKPGLVAFHGIRLGNGVGLFSKEKLCNEKAGMFSSVSASSIVLFGRIR